MIATLTIANLGPHADASFDLEPSGANVIRGPSESGKSVALDATCFALWGTDRLGRPMPVEAIRDGAKTMQAGVQVLNGTTFARRLSVSAKGTRSTSRQATSAAGEVQRYGSDKDLAVRLKILADAGRCRLIMVPFAWLPLLDGAGKGRPLRDLLERILKGPGAKEVIKAELGADAPENAKAAAEAVTHANRAVTATQATAETRHRGLIEERGREPGAPDAKAVEAAGAAIRAHEAAEVSRLEALDAHEKWTDGRRLHARGAHELQRWEQRRDDIAAPEVEKPTDEAIATLEAAANAASAAEEEAKNATRAALEARDAIVRDTDLRQRSSTASTELHRAEHAAARLESVPCEGHDDLLRVIDKDMGESLDVDCSACPLLTDAVEARDALPSLREGADQLAAKVKAAEKRHNKARQKAQAEVVRLEALAERAGAEAVDAAFAWKRAADLRQLWDTHRAAQAALGEPPTVPPHPGEEPSVPVSTTLEPTEARALLRDADRHEALHAAWERRMADAGQAKAEAQHDAKAAKDAAKRALEVLEVVRAAPGRALAGKLASLGDMGGVELHVPDEGAAIEVRIDGRPWWLASTGRRIVADVALRVAIRRAAGPSWLPIWVDEAQSVGGLTLPEIPGASIVLVTDSGPGIRVEMAGEAP